MRPRVATSTCDLQCRRSSGCWHIMPPSCPSEPGAVEWLCSGDAGIAAVAQQQRHVRGPLAWASRTRRIPSRAPPGLGMDRNTYKYTHGTVRPRIQMCRPCGDGRGWGSDQCAHFPAPPSRALACAARRSCDGAAGERCSMPAQMQVGWAAPSGSRRRYVALHAHCKQRHPRSLGSKVDTVQEPRPRLGSSRCERPKEAAPGPLHGRRGTPPPHPPQSAPKPRRPDPPAPSLPSHTLSLLPSVPRLCHNPPSSPARPLLSSLSARRRCAVPASRKIFPSPPLCDTWENPSVLPPDDVSRLGVGSPEDLASKGY